MIDREIIKKVVYSVISENEVDSIIVFGSQARGDAANDSDTDICVVTKDELKSEQALSLRGKIRKTFMASYNLDTDIIMRSRYRYDRFSGVVSAFEATIKREGMVI